MDNYDRAKEVQLFDDTKSGVKGLLDSGITKLPRFFHEPPESLNNLTHDVQAPRVEPSVPVIDMSGLHDAAQRAHIVGRVRDACSTWGMFQMVGHGIGLEVLERVIEGVRRFHEQPGEVKREWYSRDRGKAVRYYSNGDLFVAKTANWRDSIAFTFSDGSVAPEAVPLVCREEVCEYMKEMNKLRKVLSELVSEALGLDPDHLSRINCMKTESLMCHYYPPCPEPDLTLGNSRHKDPSFLTVLLQDTVGGLQVFHQGQWVNVVPIQGALVTNIGDLLQLISNDSFVSAEHRVVLDGKAVQSRVSVACFFYPSAAMKLRPYGPRPIYRETNVSEYLAYYRSEGHGSSILRHFRVHNGDSSLS